MSVLISSHLARPENFHEITRPRLFDIVEISTKSQLVKQTRGARAICVPAAPDAFSIALVTNDQALKRAVVQTKLTTFAQSFDRYAFVRNAWLQRRSSRPLATTTTWF